MVQGAKLKTQAERPFWHRKIARSGGSRYLAIGKMIPLDWLVVRVEMLRLEGKVCDIRITKLD
jgi:hypothetical protein